jgi:GTP-binding protein
MPDNQPLPALLQNPEFILGAQFADQFPKDDVAEIAFCGRSNVGKSSAINALTNRRKLARTSKTPGRTQQINFFSLDEHTRLVDLPGYGFAQVPLKVKQQWMKTIHHYLAERDNLALLVILMDCRHPLTELDRQIIEWADESRLNCHVVLTKSDKLKRGKLSAAKLGVKKELAKLDTKFSLQTLSSSNYEGVPELRKLLADQTKV